MNVLIVLTLGEFLWALVGTVWTIRGFVTGCLEPDKLSFTDTPLIAVFVVIIITWIGRKCTEIESIEPYTYKCLSYYQSSIFCSNTFEPRSVCTHIIW